MTRFELIAEVGINHNGEMEKALGMITESALCGAHWVKLQYYSTDELVAAGTLPDGAVEMVRRAELSLDKIELLMSHARSLNLKFLCTAMATPARLEELAGISPDAIKIRCADSTRPEMMAKLEELKLEAFVSCEMPPIQGGLAFSPRIHFLYCIPKYPPEPSDLNLSLAASMDGFSDHYPSILPALAVAGAACTAGHDVYFIEKHVMFPEDTAAPDFRVSIPFLQLAALAQALMHLEQAKTYAFRL